MRSAALLEAFAGVFAEAFACKNAFQMHQQRRSPPQTPSVKIYTRFQCSGSRETVSSACAGELVRERFLRFGRCLTQRE
jgi:hypothetical protein